MPKHITYIGDWGFVKDKDNRLYINNTEYVENMNDDSWKELQ